jgi:hypothetical protein
MGSLGLISFAWFVWKFLPDHAAWLVIGGATLLWAAVSAVVWWMWKRNLLRRLRHAVFRTSVEKAS